MEGAEGLSGPTNKEYYIPGGRAGRTGMLGALMTWSSDVSTASCKVKIKLYNIVEVKFYILNPLAPPSRNTLIVLQYKIQEVIECFLQKAFVIVLT